MFVPSTLSLETVMRYLKTKVPFDVVPLHEAIEQKNILDQYRSHPETRLPLLVGYDSSSRGIHIDRIDTVYILSKPQNSVEYLHMAGRTGRCGLSGKVISICTPKEVEHLNIWGKLLRFEVHEA